MTTIVTRSGKGSPLTNTELDANFNNLNAEVTPARATTRPSLLLDFAQTKQLDPRITFSRASTASYYDGKSIVKAEENLLTYSQQINGWNAQNTSTAADVAVAPDGTTTADQVNEGTVASNYHTVNTNVSLVAGLTYCFSVYAKNVSAQYLFLSVYQVGYVGASFDISSGTTISTGQYGAGYSCTSSITAVGNGWYRCSLVFTAGDSGGCSINVAYGATGVVSSYGLQVYTGTSRSAYLWGAQLEQRAYATAYTPTTGSAITNYIPALQTAASGSARFDHDPVTGESKGLLIEESRANLLPSSQNILSPLWAFYSPMSLYAANAFIAPDGTQAAHILTTTNAGSVYKDTVVSGTGTYTASAYFHTSSTCTNANLSLFFTGSSAQAVGITFNPSTGAYISSGSSNGATVTGYSVSSVGNGWYRISVSGTGSNAANTTGRVQIYSNITSQNTIAIWGAQLEVGAFATSYIPTPLTYTGRASTATYKSADGTIRIAGNDVARYEPNAAGGSNLLLEGASSHATANDVTYLGAWGGAGTAFTIPNTTDTTAPDGSYTAIAIVRGTGAQYQTIQRTDTFAAGTYTFSFYMKDNPANPGQFFFQFNDGSWKSINFILSSLNMSINQGTGTITPVGGGWYRGTWTVPVNAGSWMMTFHPYSSYIDVGNAGSTKQYLWGFQVEAGSTATSFIPYTIAHTGRASTATYYDSTGTIRTAASGQPRYTYNPSLLTAAPKLLLEAAATNLVTYSEQFDNAAWTKTRGSITANATTAPDGTVSADKFTEDTQSGSHTIRNATAITITSPTTLTASIFAKAAEGNYIIIGIGDGGGVNISRSTFDLSKGSTDTNVTAAANVSAPDPEIIYVGNGWYRCSVTATVSNVTTAQAWYFKGANSNANAGYVGDGVSGIYVWGAQVETGYAPTSYIQTTSAAVTRAADTSTSAAGSRAADVYSSSQVTRAAEVAGMTGTNFSSWFKQSEGTVCGTGSIGVGTFPYLLGITDGTDTNRFIIYRVGAPAMLSANFDTLVSKNTATQAQFSSSSSSTKFAIAYKADDFAAMTDAQAIATDTTGQVPIVNAMYIGSNGSQFYANGTIKRIAYYPRRLTNAELQGITS